MKRHHQLLLIALTLSLTAFALTVESTVSVTPPGTISAATSTPNLDLSRTSPASLPAPAFIARGLPIRHPEIDRPTRIVHTTHPRSTVPTLPAWRRWASSSPVQALVQCESTHNPAAVNGQYTGLYQMGPTFWATYGGTRFASLPLYASPDEQAQVAYTGYLDRGFEPWSCRYATGE